jgi:HAD superfamily hydrolase (TIGR01509 family)
MKVIFDCDGVLVDSERTTIEVLKRHLQTYIPDVDITHLLYDAPGRQTSDIVDDVATATGLVFPEDIVETIDKLTDEALDRGLEPISGVESMLAGLRLEKAVASNGTRSRVLKSLEVTGLDGFVWEGIFSAEQVENPKPAPDLYLFAADRLGAKPSDCLVVEDSEAGVAAASSAGTHVIGFTGASHAGSDLDNRLLNAGAEEIAQGMRDLRYILEKMADVKVCK